MLVKFEQNRMVQTTRNFELLDKKTEVFFFYKHFWQRVDAIFEDISVAEKYYLMPDYLFKDCRLSAFQKLR